MMTDKEIDKAIDELEEFFLCDMPSMVFPMDRKLNRTFFRTDFFETPKHVEKYIEDHFKILRKQIKEIRKNDR